MRGLSFRSKCTHSLNKPHSNNNLEANKLSQSSSSFHQHLHVAVEPENRKHRYHNPHRVNHRRPEMTVPGAQRRRAIRPSRFRRLKDNNRDNLNSRIQENRNPRGARPVATAFAFSTRFLLRSHGFEEFFAESARCGCCKLEVEQEESAEADCFVE